MTQYVSWPATSGIQRVLRHLAGDWPSDVIDARYGFVQGRRYVTGPISMLGSVIARAFQTAPKGSPISSEQVRAALSDAAVQTTPIGEIEATFGAYLLPEPTLREDNLAVAAGLLTSRRTIPFFIYYDALPLTHPAVLRTALGWQI